MSSNPGHRIHIILYFIGIMRHFFSSILAPPMSRDTNP